jgi:antitoxin (DNA-binding transcriptional repressor) of toxin-antitoxin stability system
MRYNDGAFTWLTLHRSVMPTTVTSTDLRPRALDQSSFVRLAAGGESVLVTDRDRVVAELVPPREGRSPMLADAQLAEAVRHGWLTPPTLVTLDPPGRSPVVQLRQLLDELERDRGDR